MTELELLEEEVGNQLHGRALKSLDDVFVVDRVAVFTLHDTLQLIIFCKNFKRREYSFDSFASHVTLL